MDDILGKSNKNSNVKAKSEMIDSARKNIIKMKRKSRQVRLGFSRPRLPEGYSLPKRVRALSKFVGRRKAFDIFNIAKKLGEGSFGAVYSDKGLAIKVAAGSIFNKTGYKELEQEKQLLKEAESSGVSPRIISSGKGFVAIEKFEGKPLAFYEDRIKKDKIFAEYIFGKIIEAVSAIHRIGIAHRDLHNGNLFITNDYQVKIIDFGLARKGFPSAYAEAFFGNYDNPGVGILSLIDYIFKHTSSYNIYKKTLHEILVQACKEFDADPVFLFKDYESLSADEEDAFFDNFNKVRFLSSEDSKRYIEILYNKLNTIFKGRNKNTITPKTGVIANYPIKKFAEGGEVNKPILSLVGEKKGIIRAKTPLLEQSKKLKILLKKSRNSVVTADQIGIILNNLNKSDLTGIKHYIKPSNKPTAIFNITDNSFYSFLQRFNEFLGNFVRTLNMLMQKVRYAYLFIKREDERFDKRQEKIRRFVEKVVRKKKEKKEKQDKTKADLKGAFPGGNILETLMTSISAAGARTADELIPPPTGPIPEGTNADFWTLAAIASLESGHPQGQADVAQTIYNRLQSGISSQYGGNTIKTLIISPNQYSPVRESNPNLWAAINSRETAIAAVRSHPRGRDAVKKVDDAARNITNLALQRNAAEFVGGRTDFAVPSSAENIKVNGAIIDRNRHGHAIGWFVGGGSVNYGRSNPPARPMPPFPGITINRASGSILLPELFGPDKINITEDSSSLSSYLVNKPTIFKMGPYDEPMIIIPLGRTKGREIMNLIFKEPFKKLENKIENSYKNKTPLNLVFNNVNFIDTDTLNNSVYKNSTDNFSIQKNSDFYYQRSNNTSNDSRLSYNYKKSDKNSKNTLIDNISNSYSKSNSTNRVVIYTQDIYVT